MRTDRLTPTRAAGLALGLTILFSSGCVVGPRYRPPADTLTALHNTGAAEARNTQLPVPPLDRWWTGFDDPGLTRVVEGALQQNLDLSAALARVDQARAVAREAGARELPSGAATLQEVRLRQSLDSPIGAIGRHLPGYYRNQVLDDVGVGASWEADLFGGLRRGAEAARADAEAVAAEQLGVRITVAAEAADAYLQVRGTQARLAFASSQIATDEQLLELVRLRASDGAAADREVAQATALLAQARSTVPPLRTVLEAQLNRLDVLMGAQPGTLSAELKAPGAIPVAPGVSLRTAAADLLRRRPDVIIAERRVAASNARIGFALSEYYPKVSLSGLLGFESLSTGKLFTAEAFQPEALAGLRWRLFDFGRVDAQVAQARAANAEALAHYRQSMLRAAEDVEDAVTALIQSEDQSRQLTEEVTALRRARDLSQEDYRAGAIALTDVLDADRQLLLAQDQQALVQAEASRSAVAVFRALGGGW